MGYMSFLLDAKGKDAHEAFEDLVAEDKEIFRNDPYNRSISLCQFAGCSRIADICSEASIREAKKIINQEGFGERMKAKAIDCGVCSYKTKEVSKKPFNSEEDPKFSRRYVVLEQYLGYEKIVRNAIYSKQKYAEAKAEELIERNIDRAKTYCVARRPVIVNGVSDHVAEYDTESEEEHYFLFYGFSPC